MNHPTTVQVLDLSESTITADSSFRPFPQASPGNFEITLQGAVRDGKRVHHQSISWCQSFYAHDANSMLLRLRVNTYIPPSADPWLYCFLTPYWMFTSPDGTNEEVPFGTIQNGSYAADLQAALNTSMYVSAPGVFSLAAPATSFTVQYSRATGFLITSNNLGFQILEASPWLQNANPVHGFGTYISASGPIQYSSPTGPVGTYTQVISSDSTPTLIPTRYVGVVCPELAQRRQLSSFSNVNSAAFSSGETNVFPVSYAENGVWHTQVNPADPTIINMDPSNGIQKLSLEMYNNFGQTVGAQNPWTYIAPRYLSPADVLTLTSTARTDPVQNAIVNIWSGGRARMNGRSLLSFPTIGLDVLCKPDEIVHKFLVQARG